MSEIKYTGVDMAKGPEIVVEWSYTDGEIKVLRSYEVNR